ncbi:MAG TPA: hypothetical protein VI408_06560 [Gaiellaceae bacterium]
MKKVLWLLATAAVLVLAASAAAEPPSNDNQAAAAPATSLPAAFDGTTVGATAERIDPQCEWPMSGTVWYSVSRSDDLTIVVGFQAHGELDAVVGAFQVVKNGLKSLVCVASDAHGKAGFSFQGAKDGRYLILVGQRSNSVPGTFHLTIQAPPRPANDDRAGARVLSLPASVNGTTLGASVDPATPQCGDLAGDVWYRFTRNVQGDVVLALRARGDLDGTLAVYRQVRSQLIKEGCQETDSHGRADLTFGAEKGGRYLIVVGQRFGSAPGSFGLRAFAPEPPAQPPGQLLRHGVAHATVNGLTDRDDAYAVHMEQGRSYRFNLFTPRDCVDLALYPPRTRSFSTSEILLRVRCGGYALFTPGPDGGGTYSIRVLTDEESTQPYTVWFAAAGPDDVGPGLPMANGASYRGAVNGASIDVQDLYRFDVLSRSDVDLHLHVTGRGTVRPTLLTENRPSIAIRPIRDLFRVRLDPGRYYVRLAAEDRGAARYRLGLLIREITVTTVTVNGERKASIDTAQPVTLTAHVNPASATGGIVRIQVNYHDPLQGWVFVQQFRPRVAGTEATVRFVPRRVGQYSVRAAFFGNHAASPSETDRAARLFVGFPTHS